MHLNTLVTMLDNSFTLNSISRSNEQELSKFKTFYGIMLISKTLVGQVSQLLLHQFSQKLHLTEQKEISSKPYRVFLSCVDYLFFDKRCTYAAGLEEFSLKWHRLENLNTLKLRAH